MILREPEWQTLITAIQIFPGQNFAIQRRGLMPHDLGQGPHGPLFRRGQNVGTKRRHRKGNHQKENGESPSKKPVFHDVPFSRSFPAAGWSFPWTASVAFQAMVHPRMTWDR